MMVEESGFAPENKTECEVTGSVHEWIWAPEQDDYICDACGVYNEQQEDD